ncbi:MAG TPA: lamin tail domain-containing protein, partial [Bacillota bacterium]|nr:lamin tail domain-containing protein [Bacillota bacterium]
MAYAGLLMGLMGAWAEGLPDTTTAADAVVVFNEVMYHPAGDNPALEWVELYNQMSVDIELSNWRIEGGIDFRFPAGTILPAGGYLVVAADPAALQAASGITNVVGPFSRRLSNGGELLRLRNHNGRILDEMTFQDSAPWPVGADGSGASLAKRDTNSASSPAANWQSSSQIGGTPGQENFPDTTGAGPKTDLFVNVGSPGRWRVPRAEALGPDWKLPGFNDTSWASGSASVGFDAGLPAPTQWNNVALGAAVIGGSGAYPYEAFNGGIFPAQRV